MSPKRTPEMVGRAKGEGRAGRGEVKGKGALEKE